MTLVVTDDGIGGIMHVCGAASLDPFDPAFSMYCFAGEMVASWQPVFAYARTYSKDAGFVQMGNTPFGIYTDSSYLQCGCSSGSAKGNSSGLVCAFFAHPEGLSTVAPAAYRDLHPPPLPLLRLQISASAWAREGSAAATSKISHRKDAVYMFN